MAKKRIPVGFYNEKRGGPHPRAFTVGKLKSYLELLPDELPIEHGFNQGVKVVVYNFDSNRHLRFDEIDD